MNLLDIYSAIQSRAFNEWDTAVAPLIFDNQKSEVTLPFARATFIPVNAEQIELGTNGKDRIDNILTIDVFTAIGIGIGIGTELLNQALLIFPRNQKITTVDGKVITFSTPNPRQGGDDGRGAYRQTVDFPWFVYTL